MFSLLYENEQETIMAVKFYYVHSAAEWLFICQYSCCFLVNYLSTMNKLHAVLYYNKKWNFNVYRLPDSDEMGFSVTPKGETRHN
jgi:hypothetical protein